MTVKKKIPFVLKKPLPSIWSPEGKTGARFQLLSENQAPVIRVEKWEDFLQLIDHIEKESGQDEGELIYRGERITGRYLQSALVREVFGKKYEEMKKALKVHFERFTCGRLAKPVNWETDEEMWAIGQHFGLKTPLLDWTYSPYVALFFAFEKESLENDYRIIYIINKEKINNLIGRVSYDDLSFVNIKKDEFGRLVSQSGLFIMQKKDGNVEQEIVELVLQNENVKTLKDNISPNKLAQYICKIYIKNDRREECLKILRRMNIHHGTLFPDLDGIAKHCNLLITDWVGRKKELEYKTEVSNLILEVVSKPNLNFDPAKIEGLRRILPFLFDSWVHKADEILNIFLNDEKSQLNREEVEEYMNEFQKQYSDLKKSYKL